MRGEEGGRIAGRYELGEQVGAGGSGAVFRAYDQVLGRDVAVKVMRPGADEDACARLRIEARLSGLLAHPGIVQVHDYGEEKLIGGQAAPYLVMEYVEGSSLRDLLREEAPMPPERVLHLVAQVADALAVAHGAGIVHRDVKPSNILVRPSGAVALIDFGIARARDAEPLTMTGTIVGTADYLSPEQAAGEGATPLSDLYALGLVAYECLTGERPLRRDHEVATLLAHLNEEVPPLPRSIPAPVRDLVHRLTARDPRRRPDDAATTALLARAALDPTVPLTLPSARRRRPGLAAAAAALAAAVFATTAFTGHGDGPSRARAPYRPAPDSTLTSGSASTVAVSVTAPTVSSAPTPAVVTRPTPRKVHAKPRPHSHVKIRSHGKGKGHHKRH